MNTQPDEVLHVDSENTLAAAIVYLATLAYPDRSKRARAILSMRVWCARQWRDSGQICDATLATATSNTIKAMTARDMRGALAKLNRKLFQRVKVAKAATRLEFFQQGYKRIPVPANQQYETRRKLIFKHNLSSAEAQQLTATSRLLSKPFTLNTIAKESGMSPGKFKDTVWKETLPVLHLAWGLHSQILEMDLRSYDVLILLVTHGRWTLPAIEGAEIDAQNLPYLKELHPALRRLRQMRRVRIVAR